MAVAKDRVKYAADTAKPYVTRAITDEEFRQNLRDAFAAARAIYRELGGRSGIAAVASSVAEDEKIHANLRKAIAELRQASDRIQEQERQKSHALRNIALLVTGVAIGIFFNPLTGRGTRHWVKGKVTTSRDPVPAGSPNGSSA